jgi:hypothetical protein
MGLTTMEKYTYTSASQTQKYNVTELHNTYKNMQRHVQKS